MHGLIVPTTNVCVDSHNSNSQTEVVDALKLRTYVVKSSSRKISNDVNTPSSI